MEDLELDNFDSFADFISELGDVRPLQPNDRVNLDQTQQTLLKQSRREALEAQQGSSCPLSFEGVTPLKPEDYLSYKQAGIQSGVYKNLRLGKYSIEQKLSLSGLSLQAAAHQLYQTLEAAHRRGIRTVLLQHGIGRHSRPIPALKKSYVNFWLPQLQQVIAYHTAQPQHGGLGATYVLLKKHPNQKLINREKQAKR